MCEIYDVSFLSRDRSKKYIIIYDICEMDLSFEKKVKILDIMYPNESHEQHEEEMVYEENLHKYVNSVCPSEGLDKQEKV